MNVTKPSVEIIDMKDYDEMIRKIEKIGRVCYKSEGNITEESAERFIRNILKRGHEARSVLPNSLKTEIVVTMNLRSWRNFFRLRCDSHAHPQMREVANIALDLFKKRLPIFFDDID